jgi:hypothetical protein
MDAELDRSELSRSSINGKPVQGSQVHSNVQGTIPGHELEYQLDVGHTFEKGRIMPVCGNTAAILGEDQLSWLVPHFQVASCLCPFSLLLCPPCN